MPCSISALLSFEAGGVRGWIVSSWRMWEFLEMDIYIFLKKNSDQIAGVIEKWNQKAPGRRMTSDRRDLQCCKSLRTCKDSLGSFPVDMQYPILAYPLLDPLYVRQTICDRA